MPTPAVRYYPALSTIVQTSDFPSLLDFVRDELDGVLSSIYYKDLFISTSTNGDGKTFELVVLSNETLTFEIPNTGFYFLLNPSASSDVSSFPLKLEYRWPILAYANSFDLGNFGSTGSEFFTLACEILRLDSASILGYATESFCFDETSLDSPLQKFVDDVNAFYPSASVTLPTTGNVVEQLLSNLTANTGDDLLTIIFNLYVDDADPLVIWGNLESFFVSIIPGSFEDYIKGVITPYVSIETKLSAALEVPREVLLPVNPATLDPIPENIVNGQPDGTPRAQFSLSDTLVSLDTLKGFNLETAFELSSTSPFMIGETGIVVNLDGVKLDLSDSRNIPEAIQDGRPLDFKGVYISSAALSLPENWFDFTGGEGAGTFKLTGTDLLIGSPGGLSGKLTLDPGNSLNFDLLGISFIFNELDITYKKDSIIGGGVNGQLVIPGLKDGANQDANLDYTIRWNQQGFEVSVADTEGIELTIPDAVTFKLNYLGIAKINDSWRFKVKGRIERLADIPLLGNVVPKYMDVNHFTFSEGTPNDFELVFGWDSDDESADDVTVTMTEDGLSGSEFTREIPVNKDFLGLLKVEVFKYTLALAAEELTITTTIDAKLSLGPLKGHVEGAGFVTKIDFPGDGTENVGPAKVSFDLAQPTGMGLSMDTSDWGFSVSGYLSYDEPKDLYAGAVDVAFKDINLSAYGLLNMTLPNGEEGFSLVIVISATFDPGFPIGFGFNLEGAGGLLGLHRTMNTEPLRLGVKDESLDNLLFPTPPIADRATQIFSLLENAFPIQKDQFVFGPMARITWGGDMIYADFGLLIEVDDPFRIVILGVVKSTLPSKDVANLKLQVNFLGEINFAQEYITFDASLYNSELMSLPLLGDMVLRILWGDNGGFLLSVGGLHPSFVRPTNMMLPTTINRLSLSIVNKEKVKVYGSAYFATTSNTVQFGAGAKLYVEFWDFTVDGEVGLDALIFFRPKFQFITRFYATFSVKYKRWDLLGVGIDCTLEGPSPFHLFGNGEIKILGVGISFDFDETFGDEDTRSIPSIDVGEKLTESLEDINLWNTTIPARNQLSVTLRQLPAGAGVIQLHPLGNLRVSQKTVPLGIEIQRFGNSDPEGTKLFDITGVTVQSNPIAHAVVNEQFAPAQFFHIAKTQVLKEASFRDYKGGVELNFTNADELGFSRLVTAEYLDPEVIVIDGPNSTTTTVLNRHTAAEMDRAFEGSSSSSFFDSSGKSGSAKSLRGSQKVNKLDSNLFVTVDSDGVQQGSGTFESVESAQSWIDQELLSNSGIAEDELTVVSLADLNAFSNF